MLLLVNLFRCTMTKQLECDTTPVLCLHWFLTEQPETCCATVSGLVRNSQMYTTKVTVEAHGKYTLVRERYRPAVHLCELLRLTASTTFYKY